MNRKSAQALLSRLSASADEEFVNHNHTPGRGHPNAGGSLKSLDTQRGSGVALMQDRTKEFDAEEIKSMGASAAGEAIRNSPKHNAAVQAFLNQHPDHGIPVALTGNLMSPMKYGLGAGSLKADSIGETLILRRFDGMVSRGAHTVLPLDTGHFNASDAAVSRFRNPPQGLHGESVSGNFIHFNMNYPKEATTVKEAIANLHRNGLTAYVPKAEDELVAHMQNSWADSATTNIASVTLMYAAAKQKGIPATVARVAHPTDEVRHSIDLIRNLADREYAKNTGLYDALAYGVHKVSVDHLARNDITPTDHVRIYRGMDLKGAEAAIVKGEIKNPGYGHAGEGKANVTATMNPLSSWTTDRETTTIFGTTTFRYDVVARDIFATSATGFGAANEYEVVTYGSRPRQMQVALVNYAKFPENFAVERPLEFVNHNHTLGRGHPNAGGSVERPVKQRGTITTTNGHTVTSEYMTTRKVKALNEELDRQGVDKTAPIRGVVDHPSYMMAISRKDGVITGALAYTHGTRVSQYDNQTALEDMRTSPERGGAGTALLAHVAKESLGVRNSEMAGYSMIQSAHTFYEKLGAVLHRTGTLEGGTRATGTGRWDTEALTKLADKASPLTASAEEFVNHNHTAGRGHPNAAGQFLADQRAGVEGEVPLTAHKAIAYIEVAKERRRSWAGSDSERKEAALFVDNWTGAFNQIRSMRENAADWQGPVSFWKKNAVRNDEPLYRALDLKSDSPLKVGDVVPNRLAASFSSDVARTSEFGRTTFVIEPGRGSGIPVAYLSNTPWEREWVVFHDFKVTSVDPNGFGPGYAKVVVEEAGQ